MLWSESKNCVNCKNCSRALAEINGAGRNVYVARRDDGIETGRAPPLVPSKKSNQGGRVSRAYFVVNCCDVRVGKGKGKSVFLEACRPDIKASIDF